ncbi:MAG: YncE family protein [Phycisphaerales bacterium]
MSLSKCVAALLGATAATILADATFASPSDTGFVNWETPQVSPIALTPSGSLLLAVNTADNRLEVFTARNGSLTHVRSIPVGLDPVSVRARTDSEAWVVNHLSDSVSIVDLASGRVVRTITVGDEPADVAFAGSPQRAFVTLSQLNRVLVLDPAAPSAAGTSIAIQGEDPRALAVSPDGTKVYAAIFESGNHSTLLQRQVVSIPAGPYAGQNPPPNSGTEFSPPIASGLPAPPVVSQIVRKGADGTWRDGNGRDWTQFVNWDLHDHDVAIIDAATLGVTYASGLMTTPMSIATAPNGNVMVVGTEAKNEIRFEPNVNGVFVRVEAATFAPGSPNSPSILDLNPHLSYSSPTTSLVNREQSIGDPRGVAWSPTGSAAYVAGMGSNNVIAVSPAGARLATINVGEGPTGVVVSSNGAWLYVLDRFEGAISVVNTSSNVEAARVPFFDPTPTSIKLGRPFLYDTHATSGLGQASCASCHIDGRTDHLAWDLGNPDGAMLPFTGDCLGPGGTNCVPWHPMKGPMVTQTLQGIIGNEPFHWRGEKTGIEDFNVAYTNLQGADTQLSTVDMQRLKDFVGSITYPPNPNRNLDGTLKTAIPVSTGTGNAATGLGIFLNQPVLPGGLRCVSCHALSAGTTNEIDFPVGPEPQNRKISQLRNMHEKTGASHTSLQGNRGFGFNHDGEHFTLNELLNVGFGFAPGPAGQQQRRDVEAFMLSFATDTFAAVGAQTTAANGGGAGDNSTLITQMLGFAASGNAGLVVKGRKGGVDRGWTWVNGAFQSDRASETISPEALLAGAAPGNELTYTVVPLGTQIRIGIDRDADGYFDRDEIDNGSDPADPKSVPSGACLGDIAPVGGDGLVLADDLAVLLGQWGGSGSGDLNHDGVVNGADLGLLLGAWGACP